MGQCYCPVTLTRAMHDTNIPKHTEQVYHSSYRNCQNLEHETDYVSQKKSKHIINKRNSAENKSCEL